MFRYNFAVIEGTFTLLLLFMVSISPVSIAQTIQSTNTEPFWTKGAPMPTPRTEVAATILGEDSIYIRRLSL